MTIDSLATESFPSELPVISLRELVVFPYMALPLIVAREKSIAAVDHALAGDQMILLVAQRDAEVFDPEVEELYDVENDPHCLLNLIDDPKFVEFKVDLSTQLDAWMKSQGDLGQATELDAKNRQGRARKKRKK